MSDTEHQCSFIPKSGVAVCRAEHFLHGNEWQWCLVVGRLATEEDLLDNHYLKMPADLIWQTAVGISHCPFCGEQLSDTIKPEGPRESARSHIDATGSRTIYLELDR